jgi:hypothetical protein
MLNGHIHVPAGMDCGLHLRSVAYLN